MLPGAKFIVSNQAHAKTKDGKIKDTVSEVANSNLRIGQFFCLQQLCQA